MITEKELQIASESYTKKDFYQAYPEILDFVTKITERWDPKEANESDPMVVILKILAFVVDKLNYNIDENILQCFMNSCNQEDAMRRICDVLGYDMAYYKSATTKVSFSYVGDKLDVESGKTKSITIPKFTTITNEDNSINYITTEELTLDTKSEIKSVECMEGSLQDVSVADGSSIIKLANLTNNRFYLPETMVAQNGIFIYSAADETGKNIENVAWEQTSNLNTKMLGTKCWKFGYDSKKKLPYIQFPSDIDSLIGYGLRISYLRTTGVNGNVSPYTLSALSGATKVTLYVNGTKEEIPTSDEDGNVLLVVKNLSASTNGVDAESINKAYDNYKKTVGTFDTLVTCRDYANAIYNMLNSSNHTTPLVSNCQVSDIRDDINKARKVITYGENGLEYIDEASSSGSISNFDLYLYPLNNIPTVYTEDSFNNSFKPDSSNKLDIEAQLANNKTISHVIKQTTLATDIYNIKGKYNLKATITTNYKVGVLEEKDILTNIKKALYKNFNAREVDYGEQLVYDEIESVIKNADTRIKNVDLEEPTITLQYMDGTGVDHNFDPTAGTTTHTYTSLIAKNVLAGRIPLFNYDNDFEYNYDKTSATKVSDVKKIKGTWATSTSTADLTIPVNSQFQIISPNFGTYLTYPGYVNYYWKGSSGSTTISKDVNHKLVSDEELFINYTDSDDHIIDIKYHVSGGVTYKDTYKDLSLSYSRETLSDGLIFRPNFDLNNSRANKTTGSVFINNSTFGSITTLSTLSTNQQIELISQVKATLNRQLLCYWITNTKDANNCSKITFEAITGGSGSAYTLKDNEYFFYTDSNQNTLAILGSGTRLTLGSGWSGNDLTWTAPNKEITLDEVAEYGLEAFSNSSWVIKDFASTNKQMVIEEFQIITLVEGDKIKTSGAHSSISDITTLANGETVTYTISGSSAVTMTSTTACPIYIRPRLQIVTGPGKAQVVNPSGVSGQSVQYYDGTNWTSITSNSFETSQSIQTNGDELNVDDIKILKFTASNVTDGTKTFAINDFTKIDLPSTSGYKITFPVVIPSNEFLLFMVYYTKGTGANSALVTATGNYLTKYNVADPEVLSASVALSEGINIIKVANGASQFKIEANGIVGSIIIAKPTVINGIDTANLFGATQSPDTSTLLTQLRGVTNFYYNAPLDNSLRINESVMTDHLAWYDYNNVCNKFLISQIDTTSLDNIKLSKSSKI